MKTYQVVFGLGLAAASVFACSKSDTPPAGGSTSTTSAAKVDDKAAKEIFEQRCSACHGTSGKGDGPGAAALNPKPRNYSDKTWQGATTDEQIKKAILLGGAGVGKSPIMPASPDLDSKPEVVEGLVKIVRGFGK
jgi:mono/diheme cytochrome c family protein